MIQVLQILRLSLDGCFTRCLCHCFLLVRASTDCLNVLGKPKRPPPQKKRKNYVSVVACHLSCVNCNTCHMSLTSTATALEPPPANSHIMHIRIVCNNPKINFFSVFCLGHFRPFLSKTCKI